MRATIDRAGRLVIPKTLRDRLGLRPGVVEDVADGNALRVEPLAGDDLEDRACSGLWAARVELSASPILRTSPSLNGGPERS